MNEMVQSTELPQDGAAVPKLEQQAKPEVQIVQTPEDRGEGDQEVPF